MSHHHIITGLWLVVATCWVAIQVSNSWRDPHSYRIPNFIITNLKFEHFEHLIDLSGYYSYSFQLVSWLLNAFNWPISACSLVDCWLLAVAIIDWFNQISTRHASSCSIDCAVVVQWLARCLFIIIWRCIWSEYHGINFINRQHCVLRRQILPQPMRSVNNIASTMHNVILGMNDHSFWSPSLD